MFALGLVLLLFATPMQAADDDLPPSAIVHSGDEVPEGGAPLKPEPPEVLQQQLPFKQFAAYEPALKALDDDPLLARKISVWETHIPLRRLLAQVSRNKDIVLRVTGDDAAELRLQVALKNRPLSVLMRSIARLLPGTWTKEKDRKTYTLSQTGAAEKYRRDWWSVWQQEYERTRKEQQQQTLNFLRADPNKIGDYNPRTITNDPTPLIEEHRLRRALHLLSPELQERLAGQNTDYMFYSGSFGGEKVEGALVLPWKSLPGECRDALDKQFGRWRVENAPEGEERLSVRLQNIGSMISVQLNAPSGNSTQGNVDVRTFQNIPTLRIKHGRLKFFFRSLKDKTPPAWRTLDKFAAASVWKTPEVKKPYPQWFQQFQRQFYRESLPEVLNRLHETTGAEFVVECPTVPYNMSRNGAKITTTVPPMTAKMPTDIDQILPVLADKEDKSWRKSEEGIFLMRGNRWYRQDAAIVPETKLLAWRKTLAAQKVKVGEVAAPQSPEEIRQMMDLDSEIVTALSVWQIAEGLKLVSVLLPPDPEDPKAPPRWTHPFAQMSLRLLRSRHTLHWYAGLNPNLRDLLLQGRLPASALTSAHQSQLAFIFPDVLLADPDRPIFLGVQAIPKPISIGFTGDRPLEGGYDNRTGIELVLRQPE
jgi:hypothetical protein